MITEPIPFTPVVGKIYHNHGGGDFRCLRSDLLSPPMFQNIKSGWTFKVRNVRRYPDGSIDWAWSFGGHFEAVEQ